MVTHLGKFLVGKPCGNVNLRHALLPVHCGGGCAFDGFAHSGEGGDGCAYRVGDELDRLVKRRNLFPHFFEGVHPIVFETAEFLFHFLACLLLIV